MAIHEVDTLCPICNTVSVLGHCDMTGHELKYICPECKARHYGEPDKGEAGVTREVTYVCGKCKKTSSSLLWEKIPLSAGEHILGPIDWCQKCISRTMDGRMAFIEIHDGTRGEEGRTGRVFFIKPDDEFAASVKGAHAVYIEQSVLEKMQQKEDAG